MPATNITSSPNIAVLDSNLVGDLCGGNFYVDITPSVWVGSGASNVMGASVKITNPYGATIKDIPTSGFDIYPPMTGIIQVAVPTQAGNYQYGQYTVLVVLTDQNGTNYSVSKQVNVCVPDPNNKTVNYGSLSAQLNGSCKDGKVYIIADTAPAYNGIVSNSQVNDFVLKYPTVSGKSNLSTAIGSFSEILFEGEYSFTGTICANYNIGDNVAIKINYKVKKVKTIRCLLDDTCIAAAFSQLNAQLNSDCTDAEKQATQDIIVNALYLIKTIELVSNSGQDASSFIDDLETTLGCTCTCNCAEGTPIINNNPAKDFIINGCNVTKTTVGLTDTYQIDNYAYIVAVAPNGGAITISAPILANCTQTQTITFNIPTVYSQIKGQIVTSTEYNYWASIVSKSWDNLDVTCIGYTTNQWALLTYMQRSQAIIAAICEGAACSAIISTNSSSSSAANVVASWTNVSGVYEVYAYLDGIFSGSVLYPASSYTFVGAADGGAHTYKLIAKCTNGSIGFVLNGVFTYYGCPTIAMPVPSSSNVSSASCPYDLTALVTGLPVGISAEWHNLNNTNNSSLTINPAMATGGVYYVFAKNSDGCYSGGVQVILNCTGASACSAPQSLIVEAITGGNRVRFQSAAYPPPANSYTVKRRLASDPDISGSYTTIGSPSWNATVGRWEILDTTPTANTLYVYRAISNCTSSAPYLDYTYANLTCPTVGYTTAETEIDYSFTNVGGGVDKYTVQLYTSDGVTLLQTNTHLPAFSSPITGSFIYLTAGSSYLIVVTVFIGTYNMTCAPYNIITSYNYTLSAAYNFSIDSVTGTGVPALGSTGVNGILHGHQTGITGNLIVTVSGSVIIPTKLDLSINGTLVQCQAITGAGTYTITSVTAMVSDVVLITIDSGTC